MPTITESNVAIKVTPVCTYDELVYKARTDGRLAESRQRFRLIDLYAGAGGMTLGFSQGMGHHFQPVWANNIDEDAVATYNANFGNHCVAGDIVDILRDPSTVIPQADIVIGGPPGVQPRHVTTTGLDRGSKIL